LREARLKPEFVDCGLRGQPDEDDMYGPYNHGWMFDGGVGMLFGGLWMILVLVVPLVLLAVLLKYLFAKPRGNGDRQGLPETQTPLDVLKAAYARGEISREEFLRKRDDILEK
jgi:putative membrane protein